MGNVNMGPEMGNVNMGPICFRRKINTFHQKLSVPWRNCGIFPPFTVVVVNIESHLILGIESRKELLY